MTIFIFFIFFFVLFYLFHCLILYFLVERTAVDKCNARVVVLEQEIAKLATGDHDTARTLQAESTVIEKLMQQRSALQRQRDECIL